MTNRIGILKFPSIAFRQPPSACFFLAVRTQVPAAMIFRGAWDPPDLRSESRLIQAKHGNPIFLAGDVHAQARRAVLASDS